MSPEEHYLKEKQLRKINSIWKVLHIFVFLAIALAGFVATYLFGQAMIGFKFKCILYANISFSNITNETANYESLSALVANDLPMIYYRNTTWGAPSYCNFCQFMPLVSMISAITLGVFFILTAKGGEGNTTDLLERPWKIVAPTSLFCILILIPSAISVSFSDNGYNIFCGNFPFLGETCTRKIDLYTVQLFGKEVIFYSYYQAFLIATKITLYLWCCQLALLVLRMIFNTDFQFVKVTSTKVDSDVEKHKIVDPKYEKIDGNLEEEV